MRKVSMYLTKCPPVVGSYCYLVLVKFVDFEYAVAVIDSDPHFVQDPRAGQRRQRTDIGKYSFVNRTIQDWNQLSAEVLGTLPCKPNTLKERVRKAIIEVS
jgi:hypothetical protein